MDIMSAEQEREAAEYRAREAEAALEAKAREEVAFRRALAKAEAEAVAAEAAKAEAEAAARRGPLSYLDKISANLQHERDQRAAMGGRGLSSHRRADAPGSIGSTPSPATPIAGPTSQLDQIAANMQSQREHEGGRGLSSGQRR